jgi:hypothetical protein
MYSLIEIDFFPIDAQRKTDGTHFKDMSTLLTGLLWNIMEYS